MKVRIIMQTSENGEYESVTFSVDFETPLSDFKNPQSDEIRGAVVDIDLPNRFPLEYELVRK
jgi:hypothetical protein